MATDYPIDRTTKFDKVDNMIRRRPSEASEIVDRRNESRKWLQVNHWDMWEEVYRNSKCLTRPVMTKVNGKEVEDKSRTNVCMPETSLTCRRKTARLTANPPEIKYTGGDEYTGQRLTGWSYQQFDHSAEAQNHEKLIQTGVTFGWSASKLSWDVIAPRRRWQRSFYDRNTGAITYDDRAGVMRALGAPPDEIEQMVSELGDKLDPEEVQEAVAHLGETFMATEEIKKYEGPIVTTPFLGDLFPEPGCDRLKRSGWITENYPETDKWLEKQLQLRYIDEETGDEVQAFSEKACQDLIDMGSWTPSQSSMQPMDLRTRFRTSVLGQVVPLFPAKLLRGKRFDILEHHQAGEDGRMWIEWVGNETIYLGAMPYPWELYGDTTYTELQLLPDIMQAQGDSIPILHRFLQALHNSTVGQRKDLVNNILRPLYLKKPGFDVDEEVLERKLMRFITVRDFESIRPLIENPIIGEAIQSSSEEEAQIMRMWGLSDPSLSNVESGTNLQPQSGKTATTAVLSAKSADALTQLELNGVSGYLKELGQKKLWMLQQVERENNEPYKIQPKYVQKVQALSSRFTGTIQAVDLYPDELAQDFEVEPEAMSMLSVDDDLRRQSAMTMAGMAAAAPNLWDPYYVNRFAASTVRGIDPDKAVPPPKPPPPPPPVEPRVSFSISAKFEDLEPEIQLQILQKQGFTVSPEMAQNVQLKGQVKDVQHLSAGADAAHNLTLTGDEPPPGKTNGYSGPETSMSKGVGQ